MSDEPTAFSLSEELRELIHRRLRGGIYPGSPLASNFRLLRPEEQTAPLPVEENNRDLRHEGQTTNLFFAGMRCDIASLAIDLAALLASPGERSGRFIVYLHETSMRSQLHDFVTCYVRMISQSPLNRNWIRSHRGCDEHLYRSLQYGRHILDELGFIPIICHVGARGETTNELKIRPTDQRFLVHPEEGDFIVKESGDSFFETSFNRMRWNGSERIFTLDSPSPLDSALDGATDDFSEMVISD